MTTSVTQATVNAIDLAALVFPQADVGEDESAFDALLSDAADVEPQASSSQSSSPPPKVAEQPSNSPTDSELQPLPDFLVPNPYPNPVVETDTNAQEPVDATVGGLPPADDTGGESAASIGACTEHNSSVASAADRNCALRFLAVTAYAEAAALSETPPEDDTGQDAVPAESGSTVKAAPDANSPTVPAGNQPQEIAEERPKDDLTANSAEAAPMNVAPLPIPVADTGTEPAPIEAAVQEIVPPTTDADRPPANSTDDASTPAPDAPHGAAAVNGVAQSPDQFTTPSEPVVATPAPIERHKPASNSKADADAVSKVPPATPEIVESAKPRAAPPHVSSSPNQRTDEKETALPSAAPDAGTKPVRNDAVPNTDANPATPQDARTVEQFHASSPQQTAAPISHTNTQAPIDAQATPTIQPQTFAATSAEAPVHLELRTLAGLPHVATGMEALALRIAAKSSSGESKFTIRLDPPELGGIEVRLHVDIDGHAQANLTADHARTLDLLQRDAGVLERTLKDTGLDLAGGLSFSLKSDGETGQWNGSPEHTPAKHMQIVAVENASAATLTAAASIANDWGAGPRLDITV